MSVVHEKVGLAVQKARDEAKRVLTELESRGHPQTNQSSALYLALVGIQKRLRAIDPPPAPIAQFIAELQQLLGQCEGKLASVKALIEEAVRSAGKTR
ncbi:MAG TPA: hypothetical protein VLV16_04075 [Gemmatimonadales bacterium]|nr:hypothetical protein [Gemmatimonadales bacterium]